MTPLDPNRSRGSLHPVIRQIHLGLAVLGRCGIVLWSRGRSWKQMLMSVSLLVSLVVLLGACTPTPDASTSQELAKLRAQVDALAAAKPAQAAAAAPVELGQQMLTLQIRHGRLWSAGQARNWMLTQFQLAELNEALKEVVELNGEHPALQPQRLDVVLPAIMDPAIARLQAAVDANDGAAFDAAYDGLSAACTGCHEGADHGFLIVQRPITPVLDNLKAQP